MTASSAAVARAALLVAVLGVAPLLAHAEPRFSVQVWRAEDDLPQNTIHAMAQSRDGSLWVGTEEGLARFDGARFVVLDKSNTIPDVGRSPG